MIPNISLLRRGIYVFSYRPIDRWERGLLIENSYYNTNYQLVANPIIVQVDRRSVNAVDVNKEFKAKYVNEWYVYQYVNDMVQVYPREYKWLDIKIPNKITFSTYMPDIVNTGDTLVFESEDTRLF
jgi:hypothetical protein